ncbi:MAG: inositol monophosphatase family protein [Planctomycetia bacterium]|nr:inositol monophosphatase family protein [Planctomycetia bacterium]
MTTAQVLAFLRQCADMTTRIQKDFITPATWEKKDKSPVTVGDLAVQTLVAARLAEQTPDVPLVAEESVDVFRSEDGPRFLEIVAKYVQPYFTETVTSEKILAWVSRGKNDDSLANASKFWTLDPIDGTKGFLRKEQYATALALIENGTVTLGFLGMPNLAGLAGDAPGCLMYARRGEGTWLGSLDANATFRQVRVSTHSDVRDATVLRSVESGHTNVSQMDILVERIGIPNPPVRMDSQAKYAVLASGGSDLMFRLLRADLREYKEKIWDQAAGSILLEEAGGRVTDLDGRPFDFTQGSSLKKNRGVCASNGLLHDVALRALQECGC